MISVQLRDNIQLTNKSGKEQIATKFCTTNKQQELHRFIGNNIKVKHEISKREGRIFFCLALFNFLGLAVEYVYCGIYLIAIVVQNVSNWAFDIMLETVHVGFAMKT